MNEQDLLYPAFIFAALFLAILFFALGRMVGWRIALGVFAVLLSSSLGLSVIFGGGL